MNIKREELIKEIEKNQVPKNGMMYAVYQTRVEYRAYNLTDIVNQENLANGLLELHLFDKEREYRYIQKRNGFVSTIIDDTCLHEDTYEECIYTSDDKGQVIVVNYITFDEDDLLQIDNYRLKEVE